MIEFNQKEKHNINTLQAYKGLLTSPNNHCHFTLTFRDGAPDRITEKAMNHILSYLNRSLFGRKYKKKKQFVSGFCVRERCANHTMHFHNIFKLSDNGLQVSQSDRLRPLLSAGIKTINNLNEITPKPITGQRGWTLQSYYPKDLENYLLKKIRACKHTHLVTDDIGLLSMNGVIFGTLYR